MSDGVEVWDEDAQFFREQCRLHGIRASEDSEEHFCERVSILIIEGGQEVDQAYREAFKSATGLVTVTIAT